MKQKSVYALAGVAVVATVLAIVAIFSQPRIETTDRSGAPVFPALIEQAQNGLKSIVIRHAEGTVSLDWDGSLWRYRERANYPADPQKVADLVVGIARLSKLESKTAAAARYARLDLQDPTAQDSNAKQVTLIGAEGQELADVIVGKRKYTLGGKEGGTYIRIPGDPQTWLALGDVNPGTNPRDWIVRQVANVPDAAVQRVTVTQPDGARVIAVRQDDTFVIENLPRNVALESNFAAEEYARILAGLDVEDVAPESQVAFARDKTHTAVIETVEGSRLTVDMTEVGEQSWIKISATPAEGLDANSSAFQAMTAINARAERRVFLVPAYKTSIFKRTLADLRQKPDGAS